MSTETGMPLFSTLYDMEFHRMILDEAHHIRNDHSKAFRAVSSIKALNKLCLTGTPFVNHPGNRSLTAMGSCNFA